MDTLAENESVAIKADGLTAAARRKIGGDGISGGRTGAGIMVAGVLSGKAECSQLELAHATIELEESLPLPSPTEGISSQQ